MTSANVDQAALKPIAPESEKAVLDLRRVYRLLNVHRRVFLSIFNDLLRLRESRGGERLAFGLDFDYLHAYAEPAALAAGQRFNDSVAISYILERSGETFVLLPGTILELAAYVGGQINQVPLLAARFDRLMRDLPSDDKARPLVSFALAEEREEVPDIASTTSHHALVAMRRLLGEAQDQLSRLRRLDNLLSSDRFITVDSAEFEEELIYEPSFLHLYEEALDTYRSWGRGRSNFADAANFSAAIGARRAHAKRRTAVPFLYLLTRTEAFLKPGVEAVEDEFAWRYGIEVSLTRYPIEVLYWTMLEQNFPDLDSRFAYVGETKAIFEVSLQLLERFWQSHPLDEIYRGRGAVEKTIKDIRELGGDEAAGQLLECLDNDLVQDFEDYVTANQSVNMSGRMLAAAPMQPSVSLAEGFSGVTQQVKVTARAILKSLERRSVLPGIATALRSGMMTRRGTLQFTKRAFRAFYKERREEIGDSGEGAAQLVHLVDRRDREVISLFRVRDARTVFWPTNVNIEDICNALNWVAESSGDEASPAARMTLPGHDDPVTLPVPLSLDDVRERSRGLLPYFIEFDLAQDNHDLHVSFDILPVVHPVIMYGAVTGSGAFATLVTALFSRTSRHMVFGAFVGDFLSRNWE